MLIVWPVVMAYREGAERASVDILLLSWWLLAAAGSILNFRKWERLDLGGRFGIVVLGVLWLTPIVCFFCGGLIGLFLDGISAFL